MNIVVTGSIAFDYLMSFPGRFTEHFLPEHMSRVSLSFLVDTMDKRRGGCAPNIAYTLALLGERPRLMAAAGQDFDDYRRWLEAAHVDTSLVKEVDGKFTASFFCSTDVESNQIASFYTGAMANAGELSFRDVPDCGLAIVSPNDPGAMLQYAEECRTLGIPYIWDPGQQCARMSGGELKDGLTGATLVIANDYELELIRQKTWGVGGHSRRGRVLRSRTPRQDGRPRRPPPPPRRSDRRRRRVPRRIPQRHGPRRRVPGVRPDRQRGCDVCARTPWRSESRVLMAGVSAPL
jgi:sugar/nucleoside kinase (ribokinase family)